MADDAGDLPTALAGRLRASKRDNVPDTSDGCLSTFSPSTPALSFPARKKIEEGKKKLEALKAKKKAAAEKAAASAECASQAPAPHTSQHVPTQSAPAAHTSQQATKHEPPEAASPDASAGMPMAAGASAPGTELREVSGAAVAESSAEVPEDSSDPAELRQLRAAHADALLQIERLEAQTMRLMTALNEQQEHAQDGADVTKGTALVQQLADSRADAEAFKQRAANLKEQVAEKDQQMELMHTQLQAMKDMMRAGGEAEAAELREELVQKSRDLDQKTQELDLANSQMEAIKDMMRAPAAVDELAAVKEEMLLNNRQLDQMKDLLRQAQDAAQEAEAQAANAQNEVKEKAAALDASEQRCADMAQELARVRAEHVDAAVSQSCVVDEQLEARLAQLQGALAAAEASRDGTEKELEKQRFQSNEAMECIENELAQCQDQLADLQAREQVQVKGLSECEAKLAEAKNEAARVQKEAEIERAQANADRKALDDQLLAQTGTVRSLEVQIEELKKDIDKLGAEAQAAGELRVAVAATSKERDILTVDAQEGQHRLDEVTRRLADALAAAAAAEAEAANLKASLVNAQEETAEKKELGVQVEFLKKQLEEAAAQTQLMQKAYEDTKAELENLQARPETTEKKESGAQVEVLTNQLEEAAVEIQSLQKNHHDAKAELENVQTQLEQAEHQISSLQSQLASQGSAGKSLESDLADVQRAHATDAEVARTTISDLRSQLQQAFVSLEAATEQRDAEVERCARTEQVLQEQIELLKNEIGATETAAAAHQETILSLKEQYGATLEQLHQAQDSLQEANNELDGLRAHEQQRVEHAPRGDDWQMKRLQLAAEEDEALVATLLKLSTQMLSIISNTK